MDEVEVGDVEWVISIESEMENSDDFGYHTQFSLCHDYRKSYGVSKSFDQWNVKFGYDMDKKSS